MSLEEYLSDRERFHRDVRNNLTTQLNMIIQVMSPLQLMHAKHIVHKNVNLRSTYVLGQQKTFLVLATGDLGQPQLDLYLAPELKKGGVPTPKSDIYALGVLCYCILCGEMPWDERGEWIDRRQTEFKDTDLCQIYRAL
jgi:hypothetical protein